MDVKALLGANVKRFRLALGMTQSELGDKLGLTYQSVLSYETGSKWPRDDTLAALAKVLKVRPWQLLAADGEGGSIPPDVVDSYYALGKAMGLKVSRS